MKKIKLITLCIFFSVILNSYRKKYEFEKELTKFRFSLNKELKKYKPEKIYSLSFNENDSIISLIDNFISKNKGKIETYRKNILLKYENNPDFTFNISKYKKSDKKIDVKNYRKTMPLTNLLWINPIIEISIYKTIYFSKNKGIEKLGIFNAKTQITSSLIKTKKMSNNKWEIIDNSYDIVCKTIYDMEKGKVIKIEIFERK